jgi:hypothetical protein
MTKIDLITLTGFTAVDGTIIASGATIKFSTEFNIRTTNVMVRPKIYRSRELFDLGYDEVKSKEFLSEFILQIPEVEFNTLTPVILYEKVRDYLNTRYGATIFEIIYTE